MGNKYKNKYNVHPLFLHDMSELQEQNARLKYENKLLIKKVNELRQLNNTSLRQDYSMLKQDYHALVEAYDNSCKQADTLRKLCGRLALTSTYFQDILQAAANCECATIDKDNTIHLVDKNGDTQVKED